MCPWVSTPSISLVWGNKLKTTVCGWVLQEFGFLGPWDKHSGLRKVQCLQNPKSSRTTVWWWCSPIIPAFRSWKQRQNSRPASVIWLSTSKNQEINQKQKKLKIGGNFDARFRKIQINTKGNYHRNGWISLKFILRLFKNCSEPPLNIYQNSLST